jgi:uncharacterized OsmC-like protein
MVEIAVRYEGQLRCKAEHGPSHTTLFTDAPVDNHGKGESFSPTDLVATALPSCLMTIMGIYAERHGISLTGMTARTVKVMTKEPPRRIASLRTVVTVPLAANHEARAALENAAHTCPVHKSLHPDIDAAIEFVYVG